MRHLRGPAGDPDQALPPRHRPPARRQLQPRLRVAHVGLVVLILLPVGRIIDVRHVLQRDRRPRRVAHLAMFPVQAPECRVNRPRPGPAVSR